MPHTNRVKAAMREGRVAYGYNLAFPAPWVVDILGTQPFDFVWLDGEHGPFGLEHLEHMCRAAEAAGVTPIARVPDIKASTILRFLDRGIQDNTTNQTRFVVLAHADHAPTGHDRTSICFSFTVDRPGNLYSTIGEFASRNINLVKIESRPTKQELGRYIFLIDCEGHRHQPEVAAALDGLRRRTDMLKILGSYPFWEPRAE